MPDDRGKINLKLRVSADFKEEFDRAIFARGLRGRGASGEAMEEALSRWVQWVKGEYGEPELRKRANVTPGRRVVGQGVLPAKAVGQK